MNMKLKILFVLTFLALQLTGHADQVIYDDALENSWQNWSWGTTANFGYTGTYVHSGTTSISATTGAWGALSLWHSAFNSSGYTVLTFWINGGASGGQQLQIFAELNGNSILPAINIPPLAANTWQQINVSLSALGVANQPNFSRFSIFDCSGAAEPTFYVDDISLAPFTPSNQGPSIANQPSSQTIQVGGNVSFTASATGILPLQFQWRFNGQNIIGATNTTLTLDSVTATNSGGYSVVVWNAYGSATSASASLAILTDGANGKMPAQVSVPSIPPKPLNKDSLVVITHGWEPFQPNADLSWMTAMSNAIQSRVSSNWAITNYVWLQDAIYANPELVLAAAEIHGRLYGQQLASQGWSHIHFIGHSAGAGLIENAAAEIPLGTTVQCTFLDPYVGLAHELQSEYGADAEWADCYFTQDLSGGWTAGGLPHAYNVDVDWLDPEHDTFLYGSSLIAVSTQLGFSGHGYPHDFYTLTAMNNDSKWCAAAYGFALSAEAGGEPQWANYPTGNSDSPFVLCGPPNAIPSPTLPMAIIGITFEQVSYAVSDTTAAIVNGAGFVLNSIFSVPQAQLKSGGVHPLDVPASTNAPAWLAVCVTVTNAVNFVQFDAGFTDTNAAQGLLTIYWNTNQVGMVDERMAATNLQTYRFSLPGTVTSGLYTLSFRLDSFGNSSSIAVTNVATGFMGVTQPMTLGMSVTNGAPLLQLTAATNFTYLVQTSTNLVDWTPTALLLNTDGMVQFLDSAVTNSGARFYRAVMP
jgi:hypothetical protein